MSENVLIDVFHLKGVLQPDGTGHRLPLQPSGGAERPKLCRGVWTAEAGGVGPSGEPGGERLQSCCPHLLLSQPALLQPLGEGTDTCQPELITDFFLSFIFFISL